MHDSFLPSRANAGPSVAIVFAIFLMPVRDMSSLSMMESTRMLLTPDTSYMAR